MSARRPTPRMTPSSSTSASCTAGEIIVMTEPPQYRVFPMLSTQSFLWPETAAQPRSGMPFFSQRHAVRLFYCIPKRPAVIPDFVNKKSPRGISPTGIEARRKTGLPTAVCTNAASRRIGKPLDRVSRDEAAHRAASSPFLILMKAEGWLPLAVPGSVIGGHAASPIADRGANPCSLLPPPAAVASVAF